MINSLEPFLVRFTQKNTQCHMSLFFQTPPLFPLILRSFFLFKTHRKLHLLTPPPESPPRHPSILLSFRTDFPYHPPHVSVPPPARVALTHSVARVTTTTPASVGNCRAFPVRRLRHFMHISRPTTIQRNQKSLPQRNGSVFVLNASGYGISLPRSLPAILPHAESELIRSFPALLLR
jgi:hypothetical protein